jgi:hypothetical protein
VIALPGAVRGSAVGAGLPAAQFANDFGTWFGRLAMLSASAGNTRLAALVVVADTLPRAMVGALLARRNPLTPVRALTTCCVAEALTLVVAAWLHEASALVVALFAVRAALDTVLLVTIQSAMPRLAADKSVLLRANFRLSLASAAAVLVAPVAAGMATGRIGLGSMLLIDAISYLIVLLLALAPVRAANDQSAATPAGAPRLAAAARRPSDAPITGLLLSSGLATMAGGCFNACLPVLFLGVLDGDATDLGLALTLFGVGTVLMNLLGVCLPRLRVEAALPASLLVGGALLAALAVAPSVGYSAPIILGFGAAVALRATATRHSVQLAGRTKPDAYLARWQVANNAGLLVGSAVALLVAVPAAVRPVLGVLAVVYALAAVPLLARRGAGAALTETEPVAAEQSAAEPAAVERTARTSGGGTR